MNFLVLLMNFISVVLKLNVSFILRHKIGGGGGGVLFTKNKTIFSNLLLILYFFFEL
jgi:hypothetical protein